MKSEERQLAIDVPAGVPTAADVIVSDPGPPANDSPTKKRRRRRRRWQADMFSPPAPDPHAADPARVKPRSLGLEPLTMAELDFSYETRHLPVLMDIPSREDCKGGPRPCPIIHCPSNLYGHFTPAGAYKVAFPHREPWEMPPDESCSLDVADAHDEREPKTLEEVGRLMNHSTVRTQQIEQDAFRKLRRTPFGRDIARALAARRRLRGGDF